MVQPHPETKPMSLWRLAAPARESRGATTPHSVQRGAHATPAGLTGAVCPYYVLCCLKIKRVCYNNEAKARLCR